MTSAVVDIAAALRQEWPRVALGILFLCVGLSALAITLPRWRARDERRLATIENELDAARRIQSALLPRELPRLAGLDVAVAYRP